MANGDVSLTPTETDYLALWRINPMAAEQLKNIILVRQNRELTAKLIASEAVTDEAKPKASASSAKK